MINKKNLLLSMVSTAIFVGGISDGFAVDNAVIDGVRNAVSAPVSVAKQADILIATGNAQSLTLADKATAVVHCLDAWAPSSVTLGAGSKLIIYNHTTTAIDLPNLILTGHALLTTIDATTDKSDATNEPITTTMMAAEYGGFSLTHKSAFYSNTFF
tara:strand:+ start:396 stop:866 length:471 start_codon:yes stop_codon:yes gene_type:complete